MADKILIPLMTDRDVSKLVGMSESWVRQQRLNRKQGKPHALAVDPVYLNDSPRYRRQEIEAWFEDLTAKNTSVQEVADELK